MRKIIPLLLATMPALAQQTNDNTNTNVGMSQDFSSLSHMSKGSVSAIQTYSSREVEGSQFFLPTWKPGEMLTTHGDVFNDGLVMLYDKVRQDLFIKKKDDPMVILGNKDEIYSFTLTDSGKHYVFLNSKKFIYDTPEFFYEALVLDSANLSLLKYIKTTLVKANPASMAQQTQQDVKDAWVDKEQYFIVKGKSAPVQITLKSKGIRNAFEEIGLNAEAYLKDHPGSITEEYLMDMIKDFNKNLTK